jgi:uncharacterized membrane protein
MGRTIPVAPAVSVRYTTSSEFGCIPVTSPAPVFETNPHSTILLLTSNPPPAAPEITRNQLIALLAAILGLAALSHYSESSPDAKGLGAALSVGPVVLIAVVLAWRWTRPLAALSLAAVIGVVLYRYWPLVEANYQWGDLFQQCGIYALVAASFARSMVGGRVPLCTLLAEKSHGQLDAAEIAYTRRATMAWGTFYLLLAVAILLLFFWASMRVWSVFVNFGTFGLILLMTAADHALRRRLLPRHPGGGLIAILQRTILG